MEFIVYHDLSYTGANNFVDYLRCIQYNSIDIYSPRLSNHVRGAAEKLGHPR